MSYGRVRDSARPVRDSSRLLVLLPFFVVLYQIADTFGEFAGFASFLITIEQLLDEEKRRY